MIDSFGALDTGSVSPWLLRSVFDEGEDALGVLLRHCTMQDKEIAARGFVPAETPAETPVAEAPVAEAPVAEAPVAEAPVAEAPVADEASDEASDEEEALPARPTRLLRSSRVRTQQ
jgi:hypothetical protein